MTALTRFGPSMPAIAIASTRPGNEIIISARRMMTASTTPPKYPATTPSTVPITKITATSVSAAVSEARVP